MSKKKIMVEVPLYVENKNKICFSSGSFDFKIDKKKVTGQIALGGEGFVVNWKEHNFSINGSDIAEAIARYINKNKKEYKEKNNNK